MAVPSEVISQAATQLASFKKLDQTSLVADEVVDEKDGKLTLTVSNSIHLDKDETVDAISTQLCSSIQENCVSHASNGSISISESRQPTVCNAAAEIVAEKTSHSTAAGNSLDISKASICIKAAREFGKELKPQPDACSSITNQSSPKVPGVSFDKCAAALVVTTGNSERFCMACGWFVYLFICFDEVSFTRACSSFGRCSLLQP